MSSCGGYLQLCNMERPCYRRAAAANQASRQCTTRANSPQADVLSTYRGRESDACGDVLSDMIASRPIVAFSSELWSTTDRDLLNQSLRSWKSRSSEMCPYFKERVIGTTQLQPDSFEIKWRVRWVPPQLLWLDNWGKAWPGVSVEYYDVLDRCGGIAPGL